MKRCAWCGDNPMYMDYHDKVWGVPVYDDTELFEMLTLEGAQAGLSWITILQRRANYVAAFDEFDIEKIASYGKRKINSLLKDPGIIRNRLKVESVVSNAKAYIDIQDEFGCFANYWWAFVDDKPIVGKWKTQKSVPANTPLSDKISRDLKKRGFRFVGSTIIYAYMQAVGMVNDHVTSCYRYKQIKS